MSKNQSIEVRYGSKIIGNLHLHDFSENGALTHFITFALSPETINEIARCHAYSEAETRVRKKIIEALAKILATGPFPLAFINLTITGNSFGGNPRKYESILNHGILVAAAKLLQEQNRLPSSIKLKSNFLP